MTNLITTAQELDALPGSTVALDEDEYLWIKCEQGTKWQMGGRYNVPNESSRVISMCHVMTVVAQPDQPAPSLPPTVEQIAEAIHFHDFWHVYNSVTQKVTCAGCLTEVSYSPEDVGSDDLHDEAAMDYALQTHAAEAVYRLYPTCQPSREQIARECYRRLYPGHILTHDVNRTPESDMREADRAYEIWDRGGAGFNFTLICNELADAILALLPERSESEAKAEALREFQQSIRPRTNCELRYDGSEDPSMAQWVEAHRDMDGLLQEAIDRLAGGEQR